jgi:hypothetical protein
MKKLINIKDIKKICTFMNGVADFCNFSTIVVRVLMETWYASIVLEVRKSRWGLRFDMKVKNWIFKVGIHSCKLPKLKEETNNYLWFDQ